MNLNLPKTPYSTPIYTGPVDFAKYICILPECFNGITEYGSRDSVSQELPLYSFMVMTELVTIATRYNSVDNVVKTDDNGEANLDLDLPKIE